MATQRHKYTVAKAFPYRGKVRRKGDTVTLHPREAKYLIGSHLERPGAGKAASKPKGAAATSNGGDS